MQGAKSCLYLELRAFGQRHLCSSQIYAIVMEKNVDEPDSLRCKARAGSDAGQRGFLETMRGI